MIKNVVSKYRKSQKLTLDQLAEQICEGLPGKDISRQAIHYWENGETQPNYMFLVSMTLAYKDWRFDFALECLRILRPTVWGDSIPSSATD